MIVYEAERIGGRCACYVVDGDKVRPLPGYYRECNHSPDGFNWGYGGSGPAQLAYALLRHATNDQKEAWRFHQKLKWRLVSPQVEDRWQITRADLLEMLENIKHSDAA